MSDSIFRIHPAINFARVGSSEDYYIAPETAAGEVVDKKKGIFGGLPIKKGTEDTFIEENDLRDDSQNPCRQAARFRIYAYDQPQQNYPSNDSGREIKIGDKVNGKIVKDIIWTVHLANKKGNNFEISSGPVKGEEGIVAYENGQTPPLRNIQYGKDIAAENRLRELVIDAGPRTILSSSNGNQTVDFNAATAASYADGQGKISQVEYPVSFPDDHFTMFNPLGKIDTLGQVTIEANTGRLIVVGAYGRASGIMENGVPPKLDDAIDNNNWFDDTADGPVDAVILFDDNSVSKVVGAWFVTVDPAYAPQTRNVVSCWDDIYMTWVEQLDLQPELYKNGQYQANYKPSFDDDVMSVFHAAFLQRWNTNLPSAGVNAHNFIGSIQPTDDPKAKIPNFKSLLRDPNNPNESEEGVKMPLSLGDAMKSFLSVSTTQYFLLNQWYDGKSVDTSIALGQGEKLDKVVLENCLGGRYSPGIELTFIVRDVNLYNQNWRGDVGPFRINSANLNYQDANKNKPFLGVGYIPLRTAAVEPGDLCKFMALPWHTDYNSCATHTPDPNPSENNTLYWSWPAQRPVSVYPVDQCTFDSNNQQWNLGGQLFSVRGEGTHTDYPQQTGRYQCYFDYVENWHKVGFVIQGTQIPAKQGDNYGADKFLEVSSLYQEEGDNVGVWPTSVVPGYKTPSDCGPHKK
ncbi:LodA/GoxA family CTQ-dependent oxidase [Aliikangiella sp. IMCC44359]|uniref:LodA/GoxA family CTQ-dependent oxidase n=1 Tax=Aliikangiella sp. IMCC44359 TaxID=3459125 RepID=UPI00403A94D3